jgi:large subunit ribosomal protein L15
MNLNQITKLAGADKRRTRVGRGRGSGLGKTSGRGHKGAGQRAGWSGRVLQEGGQMPLFRRVPKRGFSNVRFTTRYHVVNVASLERNYDAGTEVTPERLKESGLIRDVRRPVKVLAAGALTKKLNVVAAKFSQAAVAKIEAAGGTVRVGA